MNSLKILTYLLPPPYCNYEPERVLAIAINADHELSAMFRECVYFPHVLTRLVDVDNVPHPIQINAHLTEVQTQTGVSQ